MPILRNEACPSCKSVGRDKTNNHRMIYANGHAFCKRCGYLVQDGVIKVAGAYDFDGVGDPLLGGTSNVKPPVSQDTDSRVKRPFPSEGVADVLQYVTGIADRGIKGSLMAKYGIRFNLSESDRSVVAHYYPITVGSKIVSYKKRDCSNKSFQVIQPTQGQKVEFFGMLSLTKLKGLNLVITEGELDAPSAESMLDGQVPDLGCLSLPFGANVTKVVSDNLEFLKEQDSVVLAFDQDEAGFKAEEDFWKILPNVKVMRFSEKDPNDMKQAMKAAEFQSAYHNAQRFKPKVIASVAGMDDSEVCAPTVMGLSYPWDGLNKMTYGIHKNQVIGIGAAPVVGKTTLVRAIQQHLMFHHKEKIGIFSLEEKAEWTTRLLVGYIMNKPIHIPGTIYNQAEAIRIKKQLEQMCYFYEHKYYNGEWDEIATMIRYLHSIGVNYFFIDPLSSLVSHLTPSEANKYLSEAMYDLSRIVQTIDITVFHVNHLNTAESGKSHEAGARVYASQFTGSRAQWRYSHGLIGAERDVLATDGTNNQMLLRFLKDRAFGNTGATCILEYKKSSGRLVDFKGVPSVKFTM